MEFSFEPQNSNAGANSASDRLRKAIERNRAKQAKRENRSAGAPPSRPKVASSPRNLATPKAQANAGIVTDENQMSLMDRLKAKREAKANTLPAAGTRKTVAKPETVEFNAPVRKSKTAPAPVSYATSAKRKVKTKRKKVAQAATHIAVKLGWCFNFFLLARLVFSDGGVVDYYSNKSHLKDVKSELSLTIKENESLVEEIERIKGNPRYQRKLVRDHLGYIAKDEFLILFPKGS